MTITFNYTDQELLQTVNVGEYIDFSITASSDYPLFPINLTSFSNLPLIPGFTIEVIGLDTVRIYGNASDELHNSNITGTYIDQGESNLTQTPITTTLENIPDFKELYSLDVSVPEIIKRFSLEVTSETEFPETSTITVHVDIVYLFDHVGTWINTYFTTRY